ncbi:MAG: SDR family NAD(P)-dependent oxidoreductase [Alphaproteobacteria bacterium]
MGKLDGKVALITGAGQGVGEGIAHALAKEGAQLSLSGRTLAKVEETAQAVPTKAMARELDVRDEAGIQAIVDETIAEFGRIDILVNNAQMVPLGPLLKLKEENVEDGWQSGPMAALRFMRACHQQLKEHKGNIVNLGSSSAFRWEAGGYGAYAAVKEAIRQLTRAAAHEWGPDGIRANVILPLALSPGMKMWTEHNPEEAAAFTKTVPLGWVGDPEQDIGQAVAWLVSDEARYLTGQSIGLDGGQARLV